MSSFFPAKPAVYAIFFVFSDLVLNLSHASAAPREQLRKDVEGYAIATCLSKQASPEIRDQGDAWASAIVQRGRGEVEDWQPLVAAVDAAIRRTPMLVIKGDASVVEASKPISIAYCSELIDQRDVNRAIENAIRKMKSRYNRR